MKLQIALDDIKLEDAVRLVETVRDGIDIIEVGTPMVIEYGMQAVREMKKRFPDKEILADLKIMDAGYYEAAEAFQAGADIVTVLAVTDDLTITGCVEAARKYNGLAAADMICVADLPGRVRRLEELGIDYLSVHVGVDQQAQGRTPLDDLKEIKQTAQRAMVSVAGGISIQTLPAYQALEPDVVIVGSGITHAADPNQTVREMAAIIRKGEMV